MKPDRTAQRKSRIKKQDDYPCAQQRHVANSQAQALSGGFVSGRGSDSHTCGTQEWISRPRPMTPKARRHSNPPAPFASAKIIGASGTQELEVRRMQGRLLRQIVRSVRRLQSIVAASEAELDKGIDDFRNKKIVRFRISGSGQNRNSRGTKILFFMHSGSDWWGPDGKKLDEMSCEALVGKLRELSANKFPDSGFSAPTIEIIVTSNEGKRVEKGIDCEEWQMRTSPNGKLNRRSMSFLVGECRNCESRPRMSNPQWRERDSIVHSRVWLPEAQRALAPCRNFSRLEPIRGSSMNVPGRGQSRWGLQVCWGNELQMVWGSKVITLASSGSSGAR